MKLKAQFKAFLTPMQNPPPPDDTGRPERCREMELLSAHPSFRPNLGREHRTLMIGIDVA